MGITLSIMLYAHSIWAIWVAFTKEIWWRFRPPQNSSFLSELKNNAFRRWEVTSFFSDSPQENGSVLHKKSIDVLKSTIDALNHSFDENSSKFQSFIVYSEKHL